MLFFVYLQEKNETEILNINRTNVVIEICFFLFSLNMNLS
jgi:hypothetical protein